MAGDLTIATQLHYPETMSTETRQTVARKAIQAFLQQHRGPVTEIALRQALTRQGFTLHKTTVYRQLEALAASSWATVTRFADGVARYERQEKHHHHVVCRSCQQVEEVQLDHHLAKEERQIAKARGFTHVTHALEFFGTCGACSRRASPLAS
jgi:Fur family transcriptional regulator, ferric uptake regulator